MKSKFKSWISRGKYILIIFAIAIAFFHPIFKGLSPFPGDLLISEYNPWKNTSYLGYNPGAYPNKAQYFDVIRQFYPYRSLSWDILKEGRLPLWNPYNFSGAPLMADFQSAALYPLAFPLLIFDEKFAWTILIFIQPLLALIFTYLYARKIGISSRGSLLSSISYGFSYFMIVWLEFNVVGNTVLWLPLILLSIEQLFQRFSYKWSLGLVFGISASLFAGHPQLFGYLLAFIAVYSFFRFLHLKNKKIFLYVLFLQLISLGIGGILLLPGAELIKESARSPYPYQYFIDKVLIHWVHLVMGFIPDFFGNAATRNYFLPDTYVGKVTSIGLVPLFFIIYVLSNKKNSLSKFFILTSVLILILITANPLTLILYKFNIPFVSSSAPNFSSFILAFSLSILAGIGLDLYFKNKISLRKTLYHLIPLNLIFFVIWIVLIYLMNFTSYPWVSNLSVSVRNLIYSTGLLLMISIIFIANAYIKRNFKILFFVILILIQVFELFRGFHKFNPFVPYELIFPESPVFTWLKDNTGLNRFWGFGSGRIEADFATKYKVFSPDGLDPLYPRRYGEFIQSSHEGKIITAFARETRSDAIVAQGNNIGEFLDNKYKLKILDSLAVRFFLFRQDGSETFRFQEDRFKKVYEDNGWLILENLKASPRAFLTTDVKSFKTKEEFEALFFESSEGAVLLEEDLKIEKGESGNVSFSSYSPGEMNIKTESPNKGLLYVSETYFPGWKAYIDGEEAKIYRANYSFMGIPVPAGGHEVYLKFQPESVNRGFIVSLVSILAFIFGTIFFKNKILKNK